jgi:hypothetical protein
VSGTVTARVSEVTVGLNVNLGLRATILPLGLRMAISNGLGSLILAQRT